ncbi:transmembrane protein, putative (macronuclear) [Tetrahymena thermophila SB210]|uniref:Transmembrane protein, putative n=1 Tax=Tetrahymena thermophila (strain SB210) TaxID=312017 RepID=I7M1L9_TETTS|nr:transmembrane protein, putative [Tetrahymena thermophila SB210]EAR97147.2 transmembrane protein, putative [Tetrahymena thermophila SB210]|eukprot:XP_001017392.2 transmembrane protein, putative [Tetrahymena thermophila SB210]
MINTIIIQDQSNVEPIINSYLYLISISNQSSQIIIWDSNTGIIRASLKGHKFPIMQIHYIPTSQNIISFGSDGEVITWNYKNGQLLSTEVIFQGQILPKSPIDLKQNSIFTFGTYGDFYDNNFITLEYKTYLGHTQQVTQIFIIDQNILISFSEGDSMIIVWDRILSQIILNLYGGIKNFSSLPIQLFAKQNSYQQYFIQIVITNSLTMKTYLIPLQINFDNQKNIWSNQMLDQVLLTSDSSINSLYVDINNNLIFFVVNQQLNICRYDDTKNDLIINQQIQLSSILQISNQDNITQLIYNSNSILLISDLGQLFLIKYNPENPQAQIILNSIPLQIVLNTQIINGFMYLSKYDQLFVFGGQIVSYNIPKQNVNFVISSLQSPLPQQTQNLNRFDFSDISQIIVNTSDDGQIFIYDYFDGSFLNKITHPDYEYAPFPKATFISIVSDDNFCVSFSNQQIVCYSSYDYQVTSKFSVDEQINSQMFDSKLNLVIVTSLNTVYIFDLTANKLASQMNIKDQFYQTQIYRIFQTLTCYNQAGDAIILQYPILKIMYQANNSIYNPNNASLTIQDNLKLYEINIVCFQNGNVVIRDSTLKLIKTFQFQFSISRCGSDPNSLLLLGGSYDGTIFTQSIYDTQIFYSQKLLHFPIIGGMIDSVNNKAIFVVDYGSYGGGVLIGDTRSFKIEQTYNTQNLISYYNLDSYKNRMIIQDLNNLQISSYSISTYSIYQQQLAQNKDLRYSKVLLIQSQYLIVVISQIITIQKYISLDIFRQNNRHNSQPIDIIIDQDRYTIISISGDNTNNLQNIIISTYQNQTQTLMKIQNSNYQILPDVKLGRLILYGPTVQFINIQNGIKIQEIYGFDGNVQNIFILDDYILAYATLVLQSIDRSSMTIQFIGKSSFQIFKIVIIKNLAAMISDSNDFTIKIWDYTIGQFQIDITNTYYPQNIRNIYIDEDSDTIVVINVQNQIFTINPFLQNQEIIFWNYYSYIGNQGNYLPNNFQSQYGITIDDNLYFLSGDSNLWKMQNSSLIFVKQFQNIPTLLKLVGNVIVIGDTQFVYSLMNEQVIVSKLKIFPISFHPENDQFQPDAIQGLVFIISKINIIYQVQVNYQTSELIIKQNYTLFSQNSRISKIIVVKEFGHLIITDIKGRMFLIDYINQVLVSQLSDHQMPIRDIIINTQLQILISCSEEPNIIIYQYDQQSIIQSQVISSLQAPSQMLLNLEQNRLLVWEDKKQIITVLNIKENYQFQQFILAPGNNLVQLKAFKQINILAIFNQFQINFYNYDQLQYLFNFRNPSNINSIADLIYISDQIMLLLTQSSLLVLQFQNDTILVLQQYTMQNPIIVKASVYKSDPYLNIVGVSLQQAFNLTLVYGNQYNNKNLCYYQITDNGSQFNLLDRVNNLYQQINSYNLPIQYVKVGILLNNNAKFQFIDTSRIQNINIQIDYSAQYPFNEQNITSILLQQSDQFLQQKFIMENISVFTLPNTNYIFFQSTQIFIFKNQFYRDLQFRNVSLQLMQGNLAELDFQKFQNISFKAIYYSQADAYIYPSLLTIQNIQTGYLNNFLILNCSLEKASIYRFENIKSLYLYNIQIENIITEPSDQNLKYTIFYLANISNVYIKNVTLINKQGQEQLTLFYMQGIHNTYIQDLNVQNIQNVQIINYQNKFEDGDGIYYLKNDKIEIVNVNIQHSFSSSSELMYFQSDQIIIKNMTSDDVVCQSCYGSVINTFQSFIKLFDSFFSDNISLLGGSIFLSYCNKQSAFQNTNITKCQAEIGGALVLISCDLILQNSFIYNNEAYIGGGVRYQVQIPSFIRDINLKDKIFNNKAKIYGDNFASYPQSLKISFYDDQQTGLNSVQQNVSDLQNFQSGSQLKIQVQFIDEENQPLNLNQYFIQPSISNEIKSEIQSLSVGIASYSQNVILNGETVSFIKQYDQKSFSFKFTQLQVTGIPDSQGLISVYSPSIIVPNPQSSNFSNQSVIYSINIYFRECIEGEQYIKVLQGIYQCQTCPQGMYSLKKPDFDQKIYGQCQVCPSAASLCQNNTIILKNGYWRDSNSTDKIFSCYNNMDNCIGEDPQNINYCREGYVGPLCETCDFEGKIWGDKYQEYNNYYECQKCQNQAFRSSFQAFIFIFLILYILFCLEQMIRQNRRSAYIYYLRQMNIASFGVSEDQNMVTVYLKGMMHYMFISKVLSQKLTFSQISDNLGVLSLPSSGLKNNISCYEFLFHFNLGFYMIRNLITIFIFPLLLIIIIQIISQLVAKLFHYCNYDGFIGLKYMHSCIIIFTLFQPNAVLDIVQFVSCRQIGNNLYIVDYLSKECYTTEHLQFILIFNLPMLLLWGFILPLVILAQMKKYRNNLQGILPTLRYGFFYKEYKLNNYYWEFIKFYIKTAISIIDSFFRDQQVVKYSLVSFIIIIYLAFLKSQNPYKNQYVNKHDQIAHLILLINLTIGNISNSNSYQLLVAICLNLISFLHYLLILSYLRHILQEYTKQLAIKILQLFPSLIQKFQSLQTFVKRSKNLIQVFLNWKKVKRAIFRFVKNNNQIQSLTQIQNNNQNSEFSISKKEMNKNNTNEQISFNQFSGIHQKFFSSVNFLKQTSATYFQRKKTLKLNNFDSPTLFLNKSKHIINNTNTSTDQNNIENINQIDNLDFNIDQENQVQENQLENYNFDLIKKCNKNFKQK